MQLRRLTRLSIRYRWPLLGLWLAAVTVGSWSVLRGPGLDANELTVPGSESAQVLALLEHELGRRPQSSFTIVFPGAGGEDKAALRRRLASVEGVLPSARVYDLTRVGDVAYARLESGLDAESAKERTPDVRAALGDVGHLPALVSGWPALEYDLERTLARDLRRGEAVAVPLAVVALAVLLGFSAWLALPLLAAGCAVATALALLALLARVVTIPSLAANLVWLIGLALAIDYALLYVYRLREELARGLEITDALERTAETAGRALLFSGLAVAAGLGMLALVPVPLVAALGSAGAIVALTALAASLTLLPALGSLLGERAARRLPRAGGGGRGVWARLGGAIVRRPLRGLAVSLALLVLLTLPLARVELSPGSLAGLPATLESVEAADVLGAQAGAGALLPSLVVIDSQRRNGVRAPAFAAAQGRLNERLVEDTEPLLVASGQRPPWTDAGGRYLLIVVAGVSRHDTAQARAFVSRLREEHLPAARFPGGAEAFVGGGPAQAADFLDRSYGSLPPLLLLLAASSFLLLVRAFRSLVLPLKALFLNGVSVAAACGVLVAVFDWGWGAGALGVDAIGSVEAWVPVVLFAALFGLSLDYELFLVLRMREEWDESRQNVRAVALGLERTGRVVTAAALVMTCAFAGFLVADVAALQQLGLGLVAGVLIDVTIVRALLLPALMGVLGRYNWWLPAAVARIVRLPPTPLRELARTRDGTAHGPP